MPSLLCHSSAQKHSAAHYHLHDKLQSCYLCHLHQLLPFLLLFTVTCFNAPTLLTFSRFPFPLPCYHASCSFCLANSRFLFLSAWPFPAILPIHLSSKLLTPSPSNSSEGPLPPTSGTCVWIAPQATDCVCCLM